MPAWLNRNVIGKMPPADDVLKALKEPKAPPADELEEAVIKIIHEDRSWYDYFYDQLSGMPNMPAEIDYDYIAAIEFEDHKIDEGPPGAFKFEGRAIVTFANANVKADNSGRDWSVSGTLRARSIIIQIDSWEYPEFFGLDPE